MEYPIVATALGLMALPMYLLVLTAYDKYQSLCEPRIVTCSPVREPAAVQVAVTPSGDEYVTNCSRWPGTPGCNNGRCPGDCGYTYG